jgi:hypothetical protein
LTIRTFRKGLKEGDETDQWVATAPEGEKEKANKL